MTERDENNRKLAKWLGFVACDEYEFWWKCNQLGFHGPINLPDFYNDEAANALLLDALIEKGVSLRFTPLAAASPIKSGLVLDAIINFNELLYSSNYVDRKTAIVNAALALIARQG